MKKLTLTLTLLAMMLFATSALANPTTLTLTVSDGTNTFTSTGTNIVFFNGTVGSFTVNFAAGLSNAPGTTSFGKIDITNNQVTNNGAIGTLTFTLTGTDFTLPAYQPVSPNMQLSNSGSYSSGSGLHAGSGVVVFGFADPNNGSALVNQTSCSISGPGTNGSCGSLGYFDRTVGAYSLTEVTQLTLATGDEIDTTGSVSANAVPEPASLALLGSGLLGAGGFIRRKMMPR